MQYKITKFFILLFVLVVVTFFALSYVEQDTITNYVRSIKSEEKLLDDVLENTIERKPTATLEVVKKVIESTPLRGPTPSTPTSDLSTNGVFLWTNVHRATAGLQPLALNPKLTASAEIKMRDMFAEQYFEHSSPQGVTIGDLADKAGYEYILVGENLALGNYNGNQDLLQAWIDSPGHRANILHNRFTDIGIAVMQGTFEGEEVWLAVQEFGLPLSACPSPSESLTADVDKNQSLLDSLEKELEEKQEDLENTKPKFGIAYNSKVEEYNKLVEEYNTLLRETKTLIEQYNEQVNLFNTCAL